ncbi:MAG TPA: MBL fold metallo-hydrolase [bacterium]|nr:MBL fold metallo-hydrolase [bacterium]
MILEGFPVGPIGANCYVFGDDTTREVFVIDPGDEPDRILETLLRLSVRPLALVNTHGHFDHILAVDAVRRATGAPFWIHEAERDILAHGPARAKTMFGLDLPPAPVPDRWIVEGDRLRVGGLVVTVRHTPGHSPGGVSLLGDGLVFVGDTLFAGSVGRTDLPGADTATLLASIARVLLPLPDQTVCYPGHGPKTTIGEERRTNPFLIPLRRGSSLEGR